MKRYGNYYQLIDELRVAKNKSIMDICEGIISERTYQRYMKNGNNLNFKTVARLLERLDVQLAQFISYVTRLNPTGSMLDLFALSVHLLH